MELLIFLKYEVSKIDIKIIIIMPINVKIKCFEKKNNNLCLTFRQLMMKLMKMKKKTK